MQRNVMNTGKGRNEYRDSLTKSYMANSGPGVTPRCKHAGVVAKGHNMAVVKRIIRIDPRRVARTRVVPWWPSRAHQPMDNQDIIS